MPANPIHKQLVSMLPRGIESERKGGRRRTVESRHDVGKIIWDLVTQEIPQAQVARNTGVPLSTLRAFKRTQITDEMRKLILVAQQEGTANALDAKVNEGQDDIQRGLHGIIDEQKEIYALIKAKLEKTGDGDARDIEDVMPALSQLLRDQGASYERLLKSYTALQAKTTVRVNINEDPQWDRLQSILHDVFEQHPDAFATFQQMMQQSRIIG